MELVSTSEASKSTDRIALLWIFLRPWWLLLVMQLTGSRNKKRRTSFWWRQNSGAANNVVIPNDNMCLSSGNWLNSFNWMCCQPIMSSHPLRDDLKPSLEQIFKSHRRCLSSVFLFLTSADQFTNAGRTLSQTSFAPAAVHFQCGGDWMKADSICGVKKAHHWRQNGTTTATTNLVTAAKTDRKKQETVSTLTGRKLYKMFLSKWPN